MTYWSLMDRLVDLLELVLRYHPAPLRVLLDPDFIPSPEEVGPLLSAANPREDLGVRVDGGDAVYEAERRLVRFEGVEETILRAGGWPHIAAAIRLYRDFAPTEWALLADYVRYGIRPGGAVRNGDGGRLARVAALHGVSPETVTERRRRIPVEIARGILSEAPEGGFQLVG